MYDGRGGPNAVAAAGMATRPEWHYVSEKSPSQNASGNGQRFREYHAKEQNVSIVLKNTSKRDIFYLKSMLTYFK